MLRVAGEATRDVRPRLHLRVTHDAPEPAAVAPAVSFPRRVLTGETVDLAPGAAHEWDIALPAPPGRGTFPAVARVQSTGTGRTPDVQPAVVPVSTPDAPPGPLTAR